MDAFVTLIIVNDNYRSIGFFCPLFVVIYQ